MGRNARRYGVVLAAIGVLAAVPAAGSAATGGYMLSEGSHATLFGTVAGSHTVKLGIGSDGECKGSAFHGTISSAKVTEAAFTPASFTECKTQGSETSIPVHMNGCSYRFRFGPEPELENTIEWSCPVGKKIELTHPNCAITIGPQLSSGLSFTAVEESGKDALTVDMNVGFITQYHSGICVFLGTNHQSLLSGSMTITARDTAENQVDISVDGPPRFHAEVSHVALTGSQSGASQAGFGGSIGTVECSTVTLDGTSSAAGSGQITVIPAYSGCSGSGREWTTHMNGCAYVLTLTGTGSDGQVDIECPAGKSIETTIDKFPGGCTVTIPAQTPGGTVDYKEEGTGTGRDLLLTWTLEGIKYVRDGCEVGGEGTNGTMSGSITLSGEDTSGNPKGIWIE